MNYEKEGCRGVFGFTWIEYKVDDISSKDTAVRLGKIDLDTVSPVVQQQTLGLYIDTTSETAGIGLGYRDIILVMPAVNAVTDVDYDTSEPLDAKYRVDKKKD